MMISISASTCALGRSMLVLSVIGLSACGGGGDPETPPSNPDIASLKFVGAVESNQRVVRMSYDLDNNGTNEVVVNVSYDDLGRVKQEQSAYTSDGVADAPLDDYGFNIVSTDPTHLVSYGYNAQGLVGSYADGAFSVNYTYDSAGLLTQSIAAVPMPMITDLQVVSGRLEAYKSTIPDIGAPAQQNTVLTYDSQGRVATSTTISGVSGTPNVTTFTWRSDGLVEKVARRLSGVAAPADFVSDEVTTYDIKGRPDTVVHTVKKSGLLKTYKVTYDYVANLQQIDLGNDGSIDAVVKVETESGACRAVYLWFANTLPNFSNLDPVPYRPGSGYGKVPFCVV
jgi:YD repeat-containing protein